MTIRRLLILAVLSGLAFMAVAWAQGGRARMPNTPFKFDTRIAITDEVAVDVASETLAAADINDNHLVGGIIRITVFKGTALPEGTATTFVNAVVANCDSGKVMVLGATAFAPDGKLLKKDLSTHLFGVSDQPTPTTVTHAYLCSVAKAPPLQKSNPPPSYKSFWL